MKRSSFTKLNLKNNRTGIHQYYYLVVIKDLPLVICLCLLLHNGSASCQIIQWLGSLGSGRIFDRLKILITAETLFTRNRWIFLRCSNEAVEPLYFQAKRVIRRLVNPCSQSFLLFISMVISYIFKRGHFHKPYWLPWAPLPHPFEFCECISFKCGKMITKIIIPGRSCRVRFCGETIASPSGSFFWKEGVNRHDQQNCLMHSKITRLVTYEAVSFKEMSMRICIHRVFS